MRLINADALLDEINGEENTRADRLMREWYASMVERQETAYDVDKVMKQIDSIMEDESIRFCDQAVNAVKNIVKSGGVADE